MFVNLENLTQSSEDDFILVNIVEELVKINVRNSMKEIDMCNCNKCQLNACAIALNSLPPKYVTTTKGALLAEIGLMNPTFLFDVLVEVSKALKIVKEHPLH